MGSENISRGHFLANNFRWFDLGFIELNDLDSSKEKKLVWIISKATIIIHQISIPSRFPKRFIWGARPDSASQKDVFNHKIEHRTTVSMELPNKTNRRWWCERKRERDIYINTNEGNARISTRGNWNHCLQYRCSFEKKGRIF